MKKRVAGMLAFVMAAMLFLAVSMGVMAAQITEEEAKAIALADAGFREDEIVSIRIKTDREDGRAIFEVRFFTNEYCEYEYEIVSESGEILKASYENGRIGTNGKAVTLEEAKELAVAQHGLTVEDVTFTKMGTERDDGMLIHEIEFQNEYRQSYEYEIDADTGEVLTWEYEGEEYIRLLESGQIKKEDITAGRQPSEEAVPGGVSLDAAKESALNVLGLKAADITWDESRIVYHFSCVVNEVKYDFEVDAMTGKVLHWEASEPVSR